MKSRHFPIFAWYEQNPCQLAFRRLSLVCRRSERLFFWPL